MKKLKLSLLVSLLSISAGAELAPSLGVRIGAGPSMNIVSLNSYKYNGLSLSSLDEEQKKNPKDRVKKQLTDICYEEASTYMQNTPSVIATADLGILKFSSVTVGFNLGMVYDVFSHVIKYDNALSLTACSYIHIYEFYRMDNKSDEIIKENNKAYEEFNDMCVLDKEKQNGANGAELNKKNLLATIQANLNIIAGPYLQFALSKNASVIFALSAIITPTTIKLQQNGVENKEWLKKELSTYFLGVGPSLRLNMNINNYFGAFLEIGGFFYPSMLKNKDLFKPSDKQHIIKDFLIDNNFGITDISPQSSIRVTAGVKAKLL